VQRLTIALTEATRGWRFGPVVAALRTLRGIDTVSVIGLVSEIGDINRFTSAHLGPPGRFVRFNHLADQERPWL
jgi:hypothetical protein